MAEQPQSAFSGSEFFEKERARLVGEIGQSMEQIITNLNLLNRNLEGVVAVGKEFESVSTLWRIASDSTRSTAKEPTEG
ncbi:hypothetical protein SAICODRAFT_30670 [Saitoella complicata NRRL Y-17804]|uniref:uncharacterized protein n=1 Tax=Saitoella complicata (strain BCRC 22490 / CBS 7301 / JCM 7358 / NBRC 10748 / NRRL Y-17804) TaxID=698492 RepID=UPI0008670B62|nr:uncharacterized protein SAICODRAFT_30670 [Saitoella complicata NRRL Y-17804]ODQ52536.1 hypothetical protein SAICODRAFT_30670 [Saitoella complicata NRRL Y-17804]